MLADYDPRVPKSAAVERIQYGVTFPSSQSGDFAAFVRYSEPGVNLRLMRGGRLQGCPKPNKKPR